jgi:5-methylcytosine-specific restriction endonuclease McrA
VCARFDNGESQKRERKEDAINKHGSKWIRKDKRLAIYIRDGFSCAYCGRDLKDAAPAEVNLDHLLPRSAGGTNGAGNLITACRSCNCSRQDRPWIDYATGGARDRIEQLRHRPLNMDLARAIIAGTAGDPDVEALR